MKVSDKYRSMEIEELLNEENELRTALFKMRVGNTTKELESTAKIGQARRDLARVLTILGEKRRAAAQQ